MNSSPLKPNTSSRLLIGFTIALLFGFFAVWDLRRIPEAKVEPAKLEQTLGLTLPPSVIQVNFNTGGFIDTQIRAKFELSKRDLSEFLTANRLEVTDVLPSMQKSESGFGWWQPQRLIWAQTYGLTGDDSTRQPRTTTGFYLNVLIGQEDPKSDHFTLYLAASDD